MTGLRGYITPTIVIDTHAPTQYTRTHDTIEPTHAPTLERHTPTRVIAPTYTCTHSGHTGDTFTYTR